MRLIDADALKGIYEGWLNDDMVPYSEEFEAVEQCLEQLNDAQTIDPVKHGEWIEKTEIKSFQHTNIPVVECSNCGIDFCDIINNHNYMYHYCPNCGARMDG